MMILQKKYYMSVLLSITGVSYSMNMEQYYVDKKASGTIPLVSADTFFTDEEKKEIDPLMQSVIYTRYQIQRLTREMNDAHKVTSGSDGHYRVVRCLGNIRSVEPTIKYEAKQQQLVGEHGKPVEVSLQAKL